jgi:hypothetical protein
MEILRLIERRNYDVLGQRPVLDSADKALLFASTLLRQLRRLHPRAVSERTISGANAEPERRAGEAPY